MREPGLAHKEDLETGSRRGARRRRETITNVWIASRAGWTPYDGATVAGWQVGTLVRGRKTMWQGDLATPSQGRSAVPGDDGTHGLS